MRKDSYIRIEEILSDRSSDDFIEKPLDGFVFKWFFIFAFVIGGIIIFQLFNIGIYQHSFYSARALANTTEVKTVFPQRGLIKDRNDQALVLNESAYNIFIIPRKLSKPLEEDPTISLLSSVLEEDKLFFIDAINNKRWGPDERLFVTNRISQEKLVILMGENLPGLDFRSGYRRSYSKPYHFAHILGYTGRVSLDDLRLNPGLKPEEETGKTGLEAKYDSFLRGTNGGEMEVYNALGELVDSYMLREPKRGNDIHTFIDKEFQEFVYNRLERELDNLNRDSGLVIAMDPRNGEVISLVSFPSFDPSRVFDFLKAPHNPLFNRAISGAYAPGSTIKPLVGIAALENGIIKTDEAIFSTGQIEIPNPYNPSNPMVFRDYIPYRGWVDIYSAIARSSNVYFYEVGGGYGGRQGLGIDRLNDWWNKFGLGKTTGIDLPSERTSFLPDSSWKVETRGEPWRLGDTYNVSIGQGDMFITPIALINYISGIASNGLIYRPRIVDFISDSSGGESRIVFKSRPEVLHDLRIFRESIEAVQKGMVRTTIQEDGTARSLGYLPMTVAAKTGTAQTGQRNTTNSFIAAYAPAEEPEIVILVVVENSVARVPNTIPIARDVLLWYYENRIEIE